MEIEDMAWILDLFESIQDPTEEDRLKACAFLSSVIDDWKLAKAVGV